MKAMGRQASLTIGIFVTTTINLVHVIGDDIEFNQVRLTKAQLTQGPRQEKLPVPPYESPFRRYNAMYIGLSW